MRCTWLSVLLLAALPVIRAQSFKPGWNRQARTPPMGWRSWNAFGANINQTIFTKHIDVLTQPNPRLDDRSLASLGYNSVGIDEGWEACGQGVNGTQHDSNGRPVINTTRFPSLESLVEYGHKKGMQMGWYLNGCACPERSESSLLYKGDIESLVGMGFDQVKFDNCGALLNMSRYADLMLDHHKSFEIENCHWGNCGTQQNDSDASGCPTKDWCPFNTYRTSIDISADFSSWLHNLQTMIKFQDPLHPLSVPGCWAYPDMLEVGSVEGSWEWNRAHFGAWAITSSPLILGANLLNNSLLDSMLPIIANEEAIAVNQAWAGHPGKLLMGLGPSTPDDQLNVVFCPWGAQVPDPPVQQVGWTPPEPGRTGLVHAPGGCLSNAQMVPVVTQCNASDVNQHFRYNYTSKVLTQNTTTGVRCLGYSTWGWWLGLFDANDGNCGNVPSASRQFVFQKNSTLMLGPGGQGVPADRICIHSGPVPNTGNAVQVWSKPLPGGAVAVFAFNSGQFSTPPMQINVPFGALGLGDVPALLRDVWEHTDNGTVSYELAMRVPVADSVFVVLTPTSSGVHTID